jgi:hypothetical protein
MTGSLPDKTLQQKLPSAVVACDRRVKVCCRIWFSCSDRDFDVEVITCVSHSDAHVVQEEGTLDQLSSCFRASNAQAGCQGIKPFLHDTEAAFDAVPGHVKKNKKSVFLKFLKKLLIQFFCQKFAKIAENL